MATSAVVAMPWRAQPQREEAYRFCRRWWQFHGFDVTTSGGDQYQPFHLAEARNQAVKHAEIGPLLAGASRPPEVVIVADADTVGDIDVVREAVDLAREDDVVVYPFDQYRYMDVRFLANTDEGAHDGFDTPQFPLSTFIPKWTKPDSVGGLMVCRFSTYHRLGGMDEKFERTWGFEDRAFLSVADTLAKVVRLKGNAYSFSHDDRTGLRDWSDKNPNYWRQKLYDFAYGQPEIMRELIK